MIHGVELVSDKKKESDKWFISNHVCGTCFGRLLEQPTDDNNTIFQCSNCGATIISRDIKKICACGIAINLGSGRVTGGVKIQCVRNENITPEIPSVIIAKVIQ